MALASTATSYDAYFHACPPDLKGLFDHAGRTLKIEALGVPESP